VSRAGERAGAAGSRQATNDLLALLRVREPWWRRWSRFAAATAVRSAQQLSAHRRAALELTALHGAFLAARRPGGHRWILASWALSASHLGLLGPRRSIGWASAVTLLRANTPALRGAGRWAGLVAVASDRADGLIARRVGPTQFGHHADSLADAAFWTWFALRFEPDRRLRWAAVAAWALPVAAVTAVSITRGRMVDPPRPPGLRPAAAMQGLLAVRAARPGGRSQ
jgi:phosphatidylglycerophosphate synthase